MNTEPLRTCTHLHDHGGTCHSVAVRGQRYCPFHLRYRARQLRMAQFRARGQRFDLRLPPLEDMFAVQSALNQLVEAVAADMLDLKRAHFLLKAVRSAAQNLKWADKWPASIAHSEHAADVDLAAEYGLPGDLDLSIPPQVAFPQSVILSEDPERSEGDESKDPFVPAQRLGFDNSPMPTVDYCDHGPGCPQHTIRADYPETPELAELREIQATLGTDARVDRYKQQQRNQRRRYHNTSRKRYAAIALEKNLRLAAERLAERKLAERDAQAAAAPKKPAASASAPSPEAETAALTPTGSNG